MRRLGDYELLRKIGSGGMAEVWMGRRAAMAGASKAVAIKLLAPNVLDDPAYRDMFMEEARLSMLLTNSNVVQVFDVGEINGECFMVMEWVDGLNLSELSRKMSQQGQNLSVGIAAHVIGEVLRGLSYAHGLHHEGSKATIVHRDVSPHNVLVSVSGEVKLADFGVARLAREETSGLHVKGKLRYMAPEQLRGRSREPTVDLYAVGAILHELLEGDRFRATRDEADLYSMVLSGEHPPLTVEVPAEIEQLRASLLEPDPARRVQSADEALELLHRWSGYRNYGLELAKLIRKWIGVGAPRSGIISTSMAAAARDPGSSTASAAATIPAETRPESRGASNSGPARAVSDQHEEATEVEAASHLDSGPSEARGATQTRTFVEPETLPASLVTGQPAPAPAPLSSMLIVAAMTLALSFGIFGLGFPLGWWGAGGDSQTASSSTAGLESRDDADSASSRKDETGGSIGGEIERGETGGSIGGELEGAGPSGEETGGGETEGSLEAESADGGTGGPGADGETGAPLEGSETAGVDEDTAGTETKLDPEVKKAKPATVKINTGDYMYVWLKVGGKVKVAEPLATFKVKPGSHKIYFRVDDAKPWKSAGKLEVDGGKTYELSMTKPSGFKRK